MKVKGNSFLKVVQPVLPTQDVQSSIDFYVQQLGFHLCFQDQELNPQYAGVKRDGVELHLQWHDPAEWEAVERPSLRFVVEEIDSLFTELIMRGVIADGSTIRSTAWGTREFGLFDPSKNGLIFYTEGS